MRRKVLLFLVLGLCLGRVLLAINATVTTTAGSVALQNVRVTYYEGSPKSASFVFKEASASKTTIPFDKISSISFGGLVDGDTRSGTYSVEILLRNGSSRQGQIEAATIEGVDRDGLKWHLCIKGNCYRNGNQPHIQEIAFE